MNKISIRASRIMRQMAGAGTIWRNANHLALIAMYFISYVREVGAERI